jgi:hypothetical protein
MKYKKELALIYGGAAALGACFGVWQTVFGFVAFAALVHGIVLVIDRSCSL